MNKILQIGILISLSTSHQTASEEVDAEALAQELFAGCAAVQSLVTIMMDGELKQVILADARWFAGLVTDKSLIEKMMLQFQKGYNDGNVTWRELVDLAEECSQTKMEILSGN